MWISITLTIIGTLGGLLALWRDEIITHKKNKENIDEDIEALRKKSKTERIKILSTCFIILTLVFTIYQMHLAKISAKKANDDKKAAHILDSTRYANDSLKHIIERHDDEAHKQRILYSAKRDSISFVEQSTDAKSIISAQILTLNTQKAYIRKTNEFNKFLKNELAKQNTPILPLKFFADIEIDETNKKITNSSRDSLLPNLGLYFKIGFYDKVRNKQYDSAIFQRDSSLLRLDYNNLIILSWFKNNPSKVTLKCSTDNQGTIISYNRKLISVIELQNKILNIKNSSVDFNIKSMILQSGITGNEQNTYIELVELFKESFNPDNGRWYKIILKNK